MASTRARRVIRAKFMATVSTPTGHRHLHEGYSNEVQNLMDLVDRGCRRLMRQGGGALTRETLQLPLNDDEKATIRRLVAEGDCPHKIAKKISRAQSTVRTFLMREKRVNESIQASYQQNNQPAA